MLNKYVKHIWPVGQPNMLVLTRKKKAKRVAGSAESCPADFPSTSPARLGTQATEQVGHHIIIYCV